MTNHAKNTIGLELINAQKEKSFAFKVENLWFIIMDSLIDIAIGCCRQDHLKCMAC